MDSQRSGGGVRLTGPGKMLIILVGLAVLGYAGWTYRDRIMKSVPGSSSTTSSSSSPSSTSPATTPASGGSSGSSAASRTGVLGRIRQVGVMRVGMEPDAPPLHFLNDRKLEDGFDFRLAG